MAKNIQRQGDANSAGATIVSVKQNSVYIENRLVSVDGSKVKDHIPGMFGFQHKNVVTANGSSRLYIENKRVNRMGDADSCGHPRVVGSATVFLGD